MSTSPPEEPEEQEPEQRSEDGPLTGGVDVRTSGDFPAAAPDAIAEAVATKLRKRRLRQAGAIVFFTTLMVLGGLAAHAGGYPAISLFGVPLDFFLFGGTLIMVALSHKLKLEPRDIALAGLSVVISYHLFMKDDLLHHFTHEGKTLANLALLLTGFAVMAKLFEESLLGDWLPKLLPNDWKGGALLLFMIFMLSAFLDNIASALIGGVIAREVFKKKVSIGYLAAIVACANAGGAYSVLGDTTTTMMWIAGVPITGVLRAAIGAFAAFFVMAIFAARAQDKHQRIIADPPEDLQIRWTNILAVVLALAGAVLGNVMADFPGGGVWLGLLAGALLVRGRTPWREVKHVQKETIFILCLVFAAALMPVRALPAASTWTAFGLGWLSSIFDNIPLTSLAIHQGGYDWAVLAFAVGFGGSITWWGSSAGVALCAEHPEAKDLWAWIKQGWFVPLGYTVGFFVMIGLGGWHPSELPGEGGGEAAEVAEHAGQAGQAGQAGHAEDHDSAGASDAEEPEEPADHAEPPEGD